MKKLLLIACLTIPVASHSGAASPESIEAGRQLFQRTWTPSNPALGGDGLGPLFNGSSCVACHHQAGIGGGGDARFNAKSIGIEYMRVSGGIIDNDVVKSMVSSFHPGFINNQGGMQNTLVLHHHGGSPAFQKLRNSIMSQVDAVFAKDGGVTEPSEVRRSYGTPILFTNKIGQKEITIQARMFQRNTTALFGLGLIDQIKGDDLKLQAKLQKSHPEISGRPSTLQNGTYGKFGWRANVHSLLLFVDQASAAELGLETRRLDQPYDATKPNYKNTTIDIHDQQVIAMRDFIAAMPTPTRSLPESSQDRMEVALGERIFSKIGCAVCHVPNMGPAKGIYSDILLHDMGRESIDLNGAPPYISRVTPFSETKITGNNMRVSGTGRMQQYYGMSAPMSVSDENASIAQSDSGSSRSRRRQTRSRNRPFIFQAPNGPLKKMEIVKIGEQQRHIFGAKFTSEETVVTRQGRIEGLFDFEGNVTETRGDFVRLHYTPTKTNQEWRTPPLWGLRDSAPYMHDGRAATILEAIVMHEGEAAGTRDRFLQLPVADRQAILVFLNTMVAPKNLPQFVTD